MEGNETIIMKTTWDIAKVRESGHEFSYLVISIHVQPLSMILTTAISMTSRVVSPSIVFDLLETPLIYTQAQFVNSAHIKLPLSDRASITTLATERHWVPAKTPAQELHNASIAQ